MDRKTLMAVIVTALIVALLTSLVTVKLTGNVIKVQPSTRGQPVYNTTEVDSKFLPVKENPSLRRNGYSRVDKNLSVSSLGIGALETTGDMPLLISPRNINNHQYIFDVIYNGHPMITMSGFNEWPTIRLFDPTQWNTPARINIETRSNSFFNNLGNFGIGTTNPTSKLDVNGTIRSQDLVGSGPAYVCVTNDGRMYRSVKPCV